MAFAKPLPSPYLESSFNRAYCLYYISWEEMNTSVHTFNASKSSQMNSIGSSLRTSLWTPLDNACLDNQISEFNSEFKSNFNPLMAQATALYFRAGFDYVMIGHSWANVWNDYTAIQTDYQLCIAKSHVCGK